MAHRTSAFGADQSDIDRITRNALGRAGHHRMSRQPLLMLVVSPGERQGDIGDDPVSDENTTAATIAVLNLEWRLAMGRMRQNSGSRMLSMLSPRFAGT